MNILFSPALPQCPPTPAPSTISSSLQVPIGTWFSQPYQLQTLSWTVRPPTVYVRYHTPLTGDGTVGTTGWTAQRSLEMRERIWERKDPRLSLPRVNLFSEG